ncbi:hypothetical protein [Rhodococcus tukisamuensis]|uniref:Lipoprotein n=1 Tax=Rhodococcus tukisamuensis TaxID=168276 RepID=A0A1G6T914_9NOCA|nr:hypothetical protein [Rhodococcus tukisamuensis]SDD25354.1 hypothetical protein SAMN05444580_103436 [Rhodococcus tukisamuensis]
MGHEWGRIAAAASAGTLILTSCATNTDVPATFAAAVTVTGQASRASAASGECTIEKVPVAPNDRVVIDGDSGAAFAMTALEVDSIDENPDGTGVCTYTARFGAIPANQRNYVIWMNYFTGQSFTSDELKNGATYRLCSSAPTDSSHGADVQDSGCTP